MKSYMPAVEQFIGERREEMIELWKTLVNMQGYSRETEKVNFVIHFLRDRFEAEGLRCRLIDTKGNSDVLVAEDGPERPGAPIIMSGHVDTVFPEGSFPENPFYIEDGTAYGPGVIDMKGGVVIMLYVIKALRHLGFEKRPIKIILCGDEEIGHAGAVTGQILLDEAKGALYALNLEIGRPDNTLSVGRKGGMDCHITVHGVASHVGNDFLKGRNAIAEMALKIPKLQALTEYDRGVVVSVNVIHGGVVSNAIPDRCTAELDIRFNRISDQEPVRRKILDICSETYIEGTRTEAEFVSSIPAFEDTPANRRLLRFVNRVAEDIGITPMEGAFLGGNSDAAYLALAGAPTVCSFGVKGTGAHTKSECAEVSSLFERTALITAVIMETDEFTKEEKHE